MLLEGGRFFTAELLTSAWFIAPGQIVEIPVKIVNHANQPVRQAPFWFLFMICAHPGFQL